MQKMIPEIAPFDFFEWRFQQFCGFELASNSGWSPFAENERAGVWSGKQLICEQVLVMYLESASELHTRHK